MFNIAQVVTWFILSIFISAKISNKFLKIVFSLVSISIMLLEIVSIFLTNTLVDYRFYTHMDIGSIKGFGFLFLIQIVSFVLVFFIIIFILMRSSEKLARSKFVFRQYFIPIILFLIFIISFPSGILSEFKKIYNMINAHEESFEKALKGVGIDPATYTLSSNLSAKKGKNIIVISLESLEQGFLTDQFDHITPYLTSLSESNKWSFFNNMPVGPGSGWTAGSLYTHQVGIPAFFKGQEFFTGNVENNGHINEQGQGNDILQKTSRSKLIGLGSVLKQAGYDSRYIMGYIEYGGVKDILNTYGYKTISEKNSLGKYKHKRYGMDDYDLFSEAKLQLADILKGNKPFALFISTINSHFPNGIYDKRMEKFVTKKDNTLEFSVSSVDYLIKDLIAYLKKHNLLDNTVIYIFPDHLLMGRGGDVHRKLNLSPRKLYLLTNANPKKLHKKTNDILYQVDLPKIILEGAGIETNAKFLVDYIKNTDLLDFLNKNRIKLTTLNKAAVTKEKYTETITFSVKNKMLILKSGNLSSSINIDTNYDVINYRFSPEMVLLDTKRFHNSDILKPIHYDIRDHLLHLVVTIENGKIKNTYLGNKYKIGFYRKNIIYSDDIKNIIKSNKNFYEYENSKINIAKNTKFNNLNKVFELTKIKEIPGKSLHLSIEKVKEKLLLSAITNDPVITFKPFDIKSKKAYIRFDITSVRPTIFQIFYKRNAKANYSERDSYKIKINKGKNILKVKLASKYLSNGLRVDLVAHAGNYILNEFGIYEE